MSLAFEHDPRTELNAQWRAAVDAHKRHAASEWPREACGAILPDGSYLASANVSKTPEVSFRLPRGFFEKHEPIAILHSHTAEVTERGTVLDPQDCPSYDDMVCQIDTAVPWGISLAAPGGATDPFWFGDEVPRPPLYGRRFRHGVDDCYSFIRDWHREEAGIEIPEFPRDPDWWEPGEDGKSAQADLYQDGFESAGFARVERDFRSILPGDVFLCSVRSKVLNHGGVYVGNGLIGHHLTHQLSMRDPAAIWKPKLNFLVRHKDLPEDWRK